MKKGKRLISSLFFLILMASSAALYTGRCTFKAPSQPVWDVNLFIPLINKQYTVEELVEDSDEFIIDEETESIIFIVDDEIGRFEVGDNLAMGSSEIDLNVFVPGGVPMGWSDTAEAALVLPEEIVVEHAAVKSLELTLVVNNGTGYDGDVKVTIPAITFDGVAYTEEVSVSANSSETLPIDLTHFEFQPRIAGQGCQHEPPLP